MNKIYNNIRKILIILVTLIMVAIPIKNLFIDGTYASSVMEPEFYMSGLQCILFWGVLFLCVVLKKEKPANLLFLFSTVFLMMQGVVIPYLAVYVYFEIVCFIGFTFASRIFREPDIIYNFITGLSVWGASGIIASLLKHGTINELRILTLILLLLCMVLNKEKYLLMPQIFANFINKHQSEKKNLILIFVLVILSLILAAKTNNGLDIDSMWYILKPEYMLVGENSFYDYLGYSAFVHYYPKLVEFFFLPISGLGDYSFLLIGNVFVYNLFIVLVYKFLSFLCEECEEWIKLLLLVVFFTLPSLTSVVPSMKGDNFGGFLTLAGLYFLVKFVKERELEYLVYCLLSLFLCTGTKLTFLMWGGIIGIIVVIYFIGCIIKRQILVNKGIRGRFLIITACLNFLLVLGIHLRTYLLTGYPIYPVGLGIWEKLGFDARYAMKTSSPTIGGVPASSILKSFYEFFFSPNNLSHTVMSWPTNILLIFLFVFLIASLGKKIRIDMIGKVMLAVSIVEIALAFYNLLTLVQPDGNYFHTPLLIFLITLVYMLYLNRETLSQVVTKRIIIISLTTILLLNLPLMFVVNWSWTIGIKPFTSEIVGDNFSDYKKDEEIFKQEGCYKIAKYIESELSDKRIIASNSPLNGTFKIKGGVETVWSAFTGRWCSEDIIGSYDNFKRYVEYANIEGFLVLNTDESFFRDYVNLLAKECLVEQIIEDEGGVLYIFSY